MNIPDDIRKWIFEHAEEDMDLFGDVPEHQIEYCAAEDVKNWLDSLPTAPELDRSQPPEQ